MNPKHGDTPRTELETQMTERRRRRPDLWGRFEAMRALTEVEGGALRTAAEVEALLVEEVRRLGCAALHGDYAGAIARELPIGSGLIESGHKHGLHARLKGTGTAWLPVNADALAQLRVLRANPHWDAFWPAQQPIPTLHHN